MRCENRCFLDRNLLADNYVQSVLPPVAKVYSTYFPISQRTLSYNTCYITYESSNIRFVLLSRYRLLGISLGVPSIVAVS